MLTTIGTPAMWAGFAALVVVALIVDLMMLNAKGAKKVGFREALLWSLTWVALALVFNAWLWWYVDGTQGREVANRIAAEFFTGYLIEKSLAVDNIFVFLMLFTAFGVPVIYQRRVLVLGVIGAIVLRAVMILIGAWLLAKFHWILYVFGAFLLLTGIKMLFFAEAAPDLEKNPVLRWLRRHITITPTYQEERFVVTQDGRRAYTPLFVVMVMIAITDVIFAVDSIRSSSSPRTCSPSWACARCTSCWPTSPIASTCSSTGSRSSWCSSASRCCCSTSTRSRSASRSPWCSRCWRSRCSAASG